MKFVVAHPLQAMNQQLFSAQATVVLWPSPFQSFNAAGFMGSLPPDTLCVYCYANRSQYIPDGCCGPLCDTCFFEVSICGARMVELRRLSILWTATLKKLGKRTPIGPLDNKSEISLLVASYLWPV